MLTASNIGFKKHLAWTNSNDRWKADLYFDSSFTSPQKNETALSV